MEPDSHSSPAIRHVELKAALLLLLVAALVTGFVLYVLYARGAFEDSQQLVLIADDSEGIAVGANLTFSGFPVGRVQRIELSKNGKAKIEVEVPVKDLHWLRATSVFTLERGLVGGARLRAFTGNLDDPPLPPGAEREVLRGDATEQLPVLLARMRQVLDHIERITADDSDLNASLANLRTVTARMTGRYGALGGLLGGDDNAKKVIDALERSNALLASLQGVSAKLGRTLDKTDARVFGAGGVMDQTQQAVEQLNAMLADARASLKKADAVLAQAQKIGANTAAATEDLAALRAEVEASVRKVGSLIDEVNRKWPFKRDAEIKLP
ncbi:MAG TPA: MlaD family protein [Burkholderiales bacterium]|nr:MlaD family protein [Burkholderiales bacterium]